MPITIKDVAKSAGVSIGTVSNVFNNHPSGYREDTRERVIEAAQKLGYHPNRIARNLVRRRASALGVGFVQASHSLGNNPYLSEVMDGLMTAAREHGYHLMLYLRIPPEDSRRELSMFLDRSIDGLCMVAPDEGLPILCSIAETRLPLVVIGAENPYPGAAWIDVDNAAGIEMSIDYLYKAGHRKIAHLAGPYKQRSARIREDAYKTAMSERGLPIPETYITRSGYEVEGAYEAAFPLLSQRDRPTAICAASDEIALGALSAARKLGISVPGQLSLVGFDDIRESRYITPTLTTVKQPTKQIGYCAAKWLIQSLSDASLPNLQERVAPVLIERDSVAPPAV